MNKMKLLEKIQNHVNEGEKFIRYCSGGCYRIMLNTENADVWLDVFVDVNSYIKYPTDAIQGLTMDRSYGTTMAEACLGNAVELLEAAGWEVGPDAV